MMQAISTKFLGPTNARGPRILVKAQAGRMTVPWDDALGIEENHREAAIALTLKLGWDGVWVDGGLPSGDGNAYVCILRSINNQGELVRFLIATGHADFFAVRDGQVTREPDFRSTRPVCGMMEGRQ